MFCPYCGSSLRTVDSGEMMCEADAVFSRHIRDLLTEVYGHDSTPEPEAAPTTRWGGAYFCPGCGVATEDEDGYIRCPRCQRSLNRFLYELIELNPHIPFTQ